jgi:hypothetical protein
MAVLTRRLKPIEDAHDFLGLTYKEIAAALETDRRIPKSENPKSAVSQKDPNDSEMIRKPRRLLQILHPRFESGRRLYPRESG